MTSLSKCHHECIAIISNFLGFTSDLSAVMPPKTRANNRKANQPKGEDITGKLDLLLRSIDSLKSQNDDFQEQFGDIQNRLDTIEEGVSTPDIMRGSPSSTAEIQSEQHSTDQDVLLRKEVKRRFQKLSLFSDSSSNSEDEEIHFKYKSKSERKNLKKSGKLRTAHHKISRQIDWPQMYIFRRDGSTNGAKYDSLSFAEFMHGYLHIMSNEKNAKTRAYMYDHMINLSADATDYPWSVVRNFHSIILCMMEANRLDWHQTQVIQDLRRQYVWTAARSVESSSVSMSVGAKACPGYQTGTCMKTGNHNGLQHVCAYCLINFNKAYHHPEQRCHKKNESVSVAISSEDMSSPDPKGHPSVLKNDDGGEHI